MTLSSPTTLPADLDPGRWRALAVLLLGAFMVLLDTSIVNNGLVTIQRDLHATSAQVQFVFTSYTVAYGLLLITGGRLGDLLGRRRLFLTGLVGFILMSALCGLASSPALLIAFRVLQGLSAALLFPQVTSMAQVMFPLAERPRAFGMLGAVIGLGIVAGPLLGGLLIGANLFGTLWRPIFLINVPVGILAFLLALRMVPESRVPDAVGLDVPGALLAAGTMFLLTYPVIQGRDAGWPGWIIALLAASLPMMALFVLQQRSVLARGRAPLMQLGLFRLRAFTVGALITLVFQVGVLSYFFGMAIYLQGGLGFTPIHAALSLLAFQVAIAASSVLSSRFVARLGRSMLLIGSAMLSLGVIGLMLLLRLRGEHLIGYELIPALLVGGFGFGWLMVPLQSIVLAEVKPRFAGSASGILVTFQQIGSAFGVAVIGVVLYGQLASHADAASRAVRPALVQSLRAAGLPEAAQEQIALSFERCFRDRSAQRDPSLVPASCPSASSQALPSGVATALNRAATQARVGNFLNATEASLGVLLVVYLLCFALALFLPAQSASPQPTGARRTAALSPEA